MRKLRLDIVRIYAYEGSHLDRQLALEGIDYKKFSSKSFLLDCLADDMFDILISNGCPYILPLDIYASPSSILVNIHPSCLPQLAGCDPVPGAMLYGCNSGATCHLIDSGIDTGPILSQVEIPSTDDLDVGLLYQLSFLAEVEAFKQAYSKSFADPWVQRPSTSDIYYSRKTSDQIIDFSVDTHSSIISKVRAFGNPSQGVSFFTNGRTYKCFAARTIDNQYVSTYALDYPNGTILFSYDDQIVIKLNGVVLQLRGIANAGESTPNTSLLNS